MGCGCRKNKNNRRARMKKIEQQNFSTRLAAASKKGNKKIAKRELMVKKSKFCKACPHSRQNRQERRNKIRVCHKNNTSVQAIINNKKTKCPIGNF